MPELNRAGRSVVGAHGQESAGVAVEWVVFKTRYLRADQVLAHEEIEWRDRIVL